MHPMKRNSNAFRCVICGDAVWLPSKETMLVAQGLKECKCVKCETNKTWRTK